MPKKEEKKNIKQEKCIAFFEQLGVMDKFEAFEKMREILDEAFEEKKKELNDNAAKLEGLQQKIKAQ